jgi:cyanophycinase-like exopeptidase
MYDQFCPEPGLIILFGSGETSHAGRKIFERVFRSLPKSPRLALIETPAGFELNSDKVINRVGDFFSHRLQNYLPQVEVIPARKRGTRFSPDEPDIVAPMLGADLIFMGPGSPTYTIRQLRGSLAWYYLVARHRLGAALALASAATVAFSTYALPVYEIFKVGEELHWNEGLDFFKQYGLQLVFVPHWNNQEGGDELDTSRCFMGRERFARLMDMLPDEMTIIGLDEKTALIMDPSKRECYVIGMGKVTLLYTGHKHTQYSHMHPSKDMMMNFTGTDDNLAEIAEQRGGQVHQYLDGQYFPMSEIGAFQPYHPETSIPASIWQEAIQAREFSKRAVLSEPSDKVLRLINEREAARKRKDWATADELRQQIDELGWEVSDAKDGPIFRKIPFSDN